jgi:hypothetical protein
LQTSRQSARNLVRDAVDVRHRHPALWAAAQGLDAPVWQAREVAKRTRVAGLTLDQARWVDTQTTPYLGTLAWTKFLELVEAKIIEADPESAEARRRAAAMDQFVATGQCNEYGLKTLVAKAEAGDVIFFLAMVNRIAACLWLDGDHAPIGVRRAKAIGILANPAQALALLIKYSTTDPGTVPAPPPEDEDEDSFAQPVGQQEMHPADNDADEPAPEPQPCATCAGSGQMSGDPTPFIKPDIDLSKLLPKATMYVHVSEATFSGTEDGVVRVEGVGPVTTQQAKDFLRHCNVSVKKVVDLTDQQPVDGYEVPAPMREAVGLMHPTCVFPWSSSSSRNADKDHSKKYVPENQGGPKGQTRPDNLGPLRRPEHRVKTHGRGWLHYQPEPGVYLWRTPHGHWARVDHTGTHALGKHPDLSKYDIPLAEPPPTGTDD